MPLQLGMFDSGSLRKFLPRPDPSSLERNSSASSSVDVPAEALRLETVAAWRDGVLAGTDINSIPSLEASLEEVSSVAEILFGPGALPDWRGMGEQRNSTAALSFLQDLEESQGPADPGDTSDDLLADITLATARKALHAFRRDSKSLCSAPTEYPFQSVQELFPLGTRLEAAEPLYRYRLDHLQTDVPSAAEHSDAPIHRRTVLRLAEQARRREAHLLEFLRLQLGLNRRRKFRERLLRQNVLAAPANVDPPEEAETRVGEGEGEEQKVDSTGAAARMEIQSGDEHSPEAVQALAGLLLQQKVWGPEFSEELPPGGQGEGLTQHDCLAWFGGQLLALQHFGDSLAEIPHASQQQHGDEHEPLRSCVLRLSAPLLKPSPSVA